MAQWKESDWVRKNKKWEKDQGEYGNFEVYSKSNQIKFYIVVYVNNQQQWSLYGPLGYFADIFLVDES